MTEITWEEPPQREHYTGEHPGVTNAEILTELANHPGKWARLSSHKTANAAKQITRRLKAKHPGYEYRRAITDGRVVLYARWPEAVE